MDDEGGQVLVHAAEAVGQPGPEARPARLLAAGLDVGDGRVVVDRLGVQRLARWRCRRRSVADVRQQLADPGAGLAVLGELEQRRGDGQRLLPGGHPGDPLAHADGAGRSWPKCSCELRLVVEQVDVRRPAGHEQVDDPLGLRGEVQLRQRRRGRRRSSAAGSVARRGATPGRRPRCRWPVRPKNWRRVWSRWNGSSGRGRRVRSDNRAQFLVTVSSRFRIALATMVQAASSVGVELRRPAATRRPRAASRRPPGRLANRACWASKTPLQDGRLLRVGRAGRRQAEREARSARRPSAPPSVIIRSASLREAST